MFDVTAAATLMVTDRETFDRAVVPLLSEEQVAAVLEQVEQVEKEQAAAALAAAATEARGKIIKQVGISDLMASHEKEQAADEIFAAMVNLADMLTFYASEKDSGTEGGWTGYSTGQYGIRIPGGSLKFTLTTSPTGKRR